MDSSGGKISWIIDADNAKFKRGVDESAASANQLGDNVDGVGKRITSAFRVAGVVAVAALGAAFTGAAKASWDQADAVQQATVGLKAYEKDGNKVNSVLSNLIKYARSDMGVLFNRKDLFESAQSLKIMGDSTDNLVGHVQILSRSVGLGLSNWQDLNLIVGRVGSTGRLTGEDFDNLTKAGYRLDPAIRNTDQNFESLFAHLEKGIPVDALAGQATTIKGLSVRMESAFRGIGDAILGVDSETSKFVKGGLGDRLTTGLGNATTALKNFKVPLAGMTTAILGGADSVAKTLSPALSLLGDSITNKLLPAMGRFISSPFAQTIGGAFVVGVNLAVMALSTLVRIFASFLNHISQVGGLMVGLAASFIAYNVVTGTATLATTLLTAAQVGLNAAMRLNPFALLIAGAVGIVSAYFNVTSQTHSASDASDRLKLAQDALKLSTDANKLAQDALRGALLGQEGATLQVERAQLNYNSAVSQYGPQSLQAREASYQLKAANEGLANANSNLANKTRDAAKAAQEKAKDEGAVVAANNATGASAQSAAGGYQALAAAIRDARAEDAKSNIRGIGPKEGKAIFSIPGRAVGGAVRANRPYFVGENKDGSLNKTSELFVPGNSGSIVNSSDLQNLMGGSAPSVSGARSAGVGSANQYHIGTINISNEVDGQRWLEKLTRDQEIVSNGLVPSRSA